MHFNTKNILNLKAKENCSLLPYLIIVLSYKRLHNHHDQVIDVLRLP